MAGACTTTRAAFSFHLINQLKQQRAVGVTKLVQTRRNGVRHTALSIDISKEDKPLEPSETVMPPETDAEIPKFDKRRLEENFAVLNTGIYECRSCGHKYDESLGDPSYPIPPGLPFSQLPEDWRCPTCGAAQSFFESKRVEIAGFAQNQQYGFGGNALTSGQKALLIYGSLVFFFLLFLGGYFIQ